MKLGLSEVVLILIVMGVILMVIRGSPTPRRTAPPAARVRRPTVAEIEEERIKTSRRARLRVLGGGLLLVGVLLLASVFKIFDVLFMWYAGSALIMLAGIFVLYLSFRR
jgi:hypothetical protein